MAGVPNITGSWTVKARTTSETIGGCCTWSLGTYGEFGPDKARGTSKMSIDASKSNSIYGSSTTVTPLSLTHLPIIKY